MTLTGSYSSKGKADHPIEFPGKSIVVPQQNQIPVIYQSEGKISEGKSV